MTPINPAVVKVPDGRVGVLIARRGLDACIAFGKFRILGTYPLTILQYHLSTSTDKTARFV